MSLNAVSTELIPVEILLVEENLELNRLAKIFSHFLLIPDAAIVSTLQTAIVDFYLRSTGL